MSAGLRGLHSCGITTAGVAYCWGDNGLGQLGTGTTNMSRTPVAVAGSLRFAAISAGADYTCGLTMGSVAYCWGANSYGGLGNGSTINSNVPVKVDGQP